MPPGFGRARIETILAEPGCDALLWLRPGDLLAPGALTALALEAALTGAAAVAGLRVLFADTVLELDIPGMEASDGVPFPAARCCGCARRSTATPCSTPTATCTPRPPGRPSARHAPRIGRPVLLQRVNEAPAARSGGLAIVSLTGTGTQGGAGVAQRRLAEALALAGHRVTGIALSDRPEAAEWTDRFPRAEAAIAAAAPDLVLAGNLHGATRSLDVVGRLARSGRRLWCCTTCSRSPAAAAIRATAPAPPPAATPPVPDRTSTRSSPPGGSPACTPASARFWPNRPGPGCSPIPTGPWPGPGPRPPGAVAERIQLAFPTATFRPGDRAALRRRLGLPAGDVLILISAVIVDGPDKGFSDLRAALQAVARPGVGVVAIGRLDDPARLGLPNLFAPGLIADEDTLAAWYGACDLHVTASRHETLGQTPIEAGLCGVPTLAYRTSGLTSAVIDGVSGRLVPVKPGALARALAELVDDAGARARLGAFARIALESRHSPAAAALSLDAIIRARNLLPGAARLAFAPAMLGHFPFAAERQTGATGTVPAPSRPLVRRLRRAKQMVLGRRMPLFVRRCLYLAGTLRRSVP